MYAVATSHDRRLLLFARRTFTFARVDGLVGGQLKLFSGEDHVTYGREDVAPRDSLAGVLDPAQRVHRDGGEAARSRLRREAAYCSKGMQAVARELIGRDVVA